MSFRMHTYVYQYSSLLHCQYISDYLHRNFLYRFVSFISHFSMKEVFTYQSSSDGSSLKGTLAASRRDSKQKAGQSTSPSPSLSSSGYLCDGTDGTTRKFRLKFFSLRDTSLRTIKQFYRVFNKGGKKFIVVITLSRLRF